MVGAGGGDSDEADGDWVLQKGWCACACTNAEYSLEGLMLKLKFQYFGHLMGNNCPWPHILYTFLPSKLQLRASTLSPFSEVRITTWLL